MNDAPIAELEDTGRYWKDTGSLLACIDMTFVIRTFEWWSICITRDKWIRAQDSEEKPQIINKNVFYTNKIFWNTHCFVNFASPKKWYTHLKKTWLLVICPRKSSVPLLMILANSLSTDPNLPGMTSTDSTWVRKCEDVWGFSRWHWEFRSHPCSEATQR